jgi:hypothetical protein
MNTWQRKSEMKDDEQLNNTKEQKERYGFFK